MKRKFTSILLSVLMLTGAMPLSSYAQRTGRRVHYEHNFDSAPTTSSFTDSTAGLGMSYATGKWQIVSGKDAIRGKSVRINRADWRWWNVSYFDEQMGFSFSFSIDEHFGGTFRLCINTQDPSTNTEGLGGIAVRIEKSGSTFVLRDHGGKKVSEITPGIHTVQIQFDRGSKTYSIKLDQAVVSEASSFKSRVNEIKGMRIQHDGGSNDSYITFDQFQAYTIGRLPAQTHSYQERGAVPQPSIPSAPEDRIYAFINNTSIDLSKHGAVTEDDTVFLPLESVLTALGVKAQLGESGQTIFAAEQTMVALRPDEKTIHYGDHYIALKKAPKMIDQVLYVPLQLFAEVLGAKVWYDANTKTVVISSGEYKTEKILRLYNGQFYLGGEPYYEISFNKFDLNMQLNADGTLNGKGGYRDQTWNNAASCLAGAEKALKEMSENGFKTIRVFCSNINPKRSQKELDIYWKTVDTMYDLCDKYGIQVVACMSLTTEEFLDGSYDGGEWVVGKENYYDYFTNASSASRKNAHEFLKQYINRYKDRDTILMWEICNEGNLSVDVGAAVGSTCFSLIQLGAFYDDLAKQIHSLDSERLVTGGDSILRSAQWNLLEAVLRGAAPDWTPDTDTERLKALMLLHGELDVISMHGYDVGYNCNNGHGLVNVENRGKTKTEVITYEYLVAEAKRLGKGLYNGEAGGQMGKNYANTSDRAAAERATYLASIVNAGVQITHWWTYGSNRNGGFGNDMGTFNVTIDGTPATFRAIKQANSDLKAKWKINAADGENTDLIASGQFVTYEGTDLALPAITETDEGQKGSGCHSNLSALAMLAMTGLGALSLKRRRAQA